MNKVFTIGETVLDIIFRQENPVAAKPGGSMLNTSVSLGRAGIPVRFISEFGHDPAGDLITGFLDENGVSTRHIHRYRDGQTAIALAFLDENQNASYSFYKSYPQERLMGSFPEVGKEDILLFGSIYAITGEIREQLTRIATQADESGAIIIYDPNFRASHLPELEKVRPMIMENLSMASIVRGSDEDFLNIFASENGRDAYGKMKEAGKSSKEQWLVYTTSHAGVRVIGKNLDLEIPVPAITPVSTIGAGDAFNAGMIFWLVKKKLTLDGLGSMKADEWEEMMKVAIRFASNVCMSYENYISANLLKEIDLC
ncbi:MAG: carbohydrate kinase [bacterium]